MPRASGDDRRVVRTQRALGEALVELMLSHRFDDISVQQVLDRAGVGRATFYSHYRNKRDLLLSDTERFWGRLEAYFLRYGSATQRVAPVAELFSHVLDYSAFQEALAKSGVRDAVYDLLLAHLARLIERRLATLRPNASLSSRTRSMLSQMLAAALFEMLRWWLDHGGEPSAAEMDERFHAVVWGGFGRVAT